MFPFGLLSISQLYPVKGPEYDVNKQLKFRNFSNSFDVDIQLQLSPEISFVFGCQHSWKYFKTLFLCRNFRARATEFRDKRKIKGKSLGNIIKEHYPQSFIDKAYFVDTASDTCTLPLNPINIISFTLSFFWITSRVFLIDAILYQHLPLIQYNSYCIILACVPLNRESD